MKLRHHWARRCMASVALLLICAMLFASCSTKNSPPAEVTNPVDTTITKDNRELIGCKKNFEGTLNIPEFFYDNGTWYRVVTIGERVFNDCSRMWGVTIPDSVTSIGASAFANCGLWNLTIPGNVTSIGEQAFLSCYRLTDITISDGVTSIGPQAFRNCFSLPSITIPNSVTSIGDGAFYYCTGLTSVTLPDSITAISNEMFRDCGGLTEIVIPDSVTSIGSSAFRGCTALTSITLPSGITSIGGYTFAHSSNLKTITFLGTMEEWNAIHKDPGWKLMIRDLEIVCSDGTIMMEGVK